MGVASARTHLPSNLIASPRAYAQCVPPPPPPQVDSLPTSVFRARIAGVPGAPPPPPPPPACRRTTARTSHVPGPPSPRHPHRAPSLTFPALPPSLPPQSCCCARRRARTRRSSVGGASTAAGTTRQRRTSTSAGGRLEPRPARPAPFLAGPAAPFSLCRRCAVALRPAFFRGAQAYCATLHTHLTPPPPHTNKGRPRVPARQRAEPGCDPPPRVAGLRRGDAALGGKRAQLGGAFVCGECFRRSAKPA